MRLHSVYEMDMLDPRSLEVSFKGGGKSTPPPAAPPPNPTPPVEEAGVEIDTDEDKKSRAKTGKESLKLPLANTATTGLKV